MALHLDDGLPEGRFRCAAKVGGYFCLLSESRRTLMVVGMRMLMDGAVLMAISGETRMSLMDTIINV